MNALYKIRYTRTLLITKIMKQNTTIEQGQHLPTLLEAYDHDLEALRQRIDIDRSAATFVRQRQLRQHVADFLSIQLCMSDIALCDITPRFIHDFAAWLSTARQLLGGTVWLSCQQLKAVVGRACQRGLLAANGKQSSGVLPRSVCLCSSHGTVFYRHLSTEVSRTLKR